MTEILFVVAGNAAEFRYLRRSYKGPFRLEYLDRRERVLGAARGTKVACYGTYYARPDWPQIEEQMQLRQFDRVELSA